MKKTNFYHPKFLPTWMLLFLMKFGAVLPFKAQLFIGSIFGDFLYLILINFRKVAFVNISHCFPDKNIEQVNSLVRRHFKAIGISFFETANAYFASDKKVKKNVVIKNEKYLIETLSKNQGVILLAAHFMPLMLGGRILLLKHTIANIYRPQKNKLFDQIMCQRLTKHGAVMIKTKDTRNTVKAIKNIMPIWYAPDQDLGIKNSVFAPFFDIQTATVTATARLAKIPNTKVVPYSFIRTEDGYEMNFAKPLKDYPTDDAVKNAAITNKILQKQILKAPEQYLWVHRRFKTRPDGEISFYKDI